MTQLPLPGVQQQLCEDCRQPLPQELGSRPKYHPDCRKRVLARRNRARARGTSYAEELRREVEGDPCPVCGTLVRWQSGKWVGRYCADCRANRNARRHSDYRLVYGVDDKTAAQLVLAIACAICLRDFTSSLRPHVDHCHSTGKVRGVLCYQCNVGLGMFGNNPWRLREAAEYVSGLRVSLSVDEQPLTVGLN